MCSGANADAAATFAARTATSTSRPTRIGAHYMVLANGGVKPADLRERRPSFSLHRIDVEHLHALLPDERACNGHIRTQLVEQQRLCGLVILQSCCDVQV